MPLDVDPLQTAIALAEMSHRFHARGWVLGTSGNFSAVLTRRPLRLAITASGRDKRALRPEDVLTIDEHGAVLDVPGHPASGRPSAETRLHLVIEDVCHAGAIAHTHSVWGTLLSDQFASGGLRIHGYEMLKGLQGVTSHEHDEWIPILENDQDMSRLADVLRHTLAQHPGAHAVLLRRHGLYTWGDTLADAERHVEILEFLFETLGRTRAFTSGHGAGGG